MIYIYIYIYYVVLKKRMARTLFRPLFQNVVSELCLGIFNVVLALFLVKLEAGNAELQSWKLEAIVRSWK